MKDSREFTVAHEGLWCLILFTHANCCGQGLPYTSIVQKWFEALWFQSEVDHRNPRALTRRVFLFCCSTVFVFWGQGSVCFSCEQSEAVHCLWSQVSVYGWFVVYADALNRFVAVYEWVVVWVVWDSASCLWSFWLVCVVGFSLCGRFRDTLSIPLKCRHHYCFKKTLYFREIRLSGFSVQFLK